LTCVQVAPILPVEVEVEDPRKTQVAAIASDLWSAIQDGIRAALKREQDRTLIDRTAGQRFVRAVVALVELTRR
jgi:hypothetical protein